MTDFGNIIGPTDGRRRWGRAQNRAFTDPYKSVKKQLEPTVCPQCGAVYHGGRWGMVELMVGHGGVHALAITRKSCVDGKQKRRKALLWYRGCLRFCF